ncbi:DUF262 domain-containing protein [Pedobacter sp. WC2501]|uniref:DUF262 domain-containing protein n=1 Tax=Pedobacter sp. WC2501 TaxID=3461400 RepID=UPI004045D654
MEQTTNDTQEQQYLNSESGIEYEEEFYKEMDPFDPEEISIDSKVVPMETFLRRLTQGTIILNPDFQRNEVWTMEKKSQLIESLLLKIPLPMFYVSADEKNTYTVVDGLQRLSTIRSFILGDKYLETSNDAERGRGFKLQDLEFWKVYNGRNFNELPTNLQNRLIESEFRFTVINPGTPEEVRRNIFKRLNTGGMPLSSQEIRNALYLGPSTILLNELSSFESFKEATAYSIKSTRMEDKELILRFLSFLLRDFTTYRRAVSIDTYLSDTMIILNSLPNLNTRELQKSIRNGNIIASDINILSFEDIKLKFDFAMKRSFKLFNKHSFRKSYGENRRTAINKALFETWGVTLANLNENEFNSLLENKENFQNDYAPIISDYNFQLSISRDSMKTPSVKNRFEEFSSLISKYIS